MSAVLELTDLQPVADLIERLQNVQRGIKDLHDAHDDAEDFAVAITSKPQYEKEAPVAHLHRLSYWVVLQGLAAMERELRMQLQKHEITVESVLPIKEAAHV